MGDVIMRQAESDFNDANPDDGREPPTLISASRAARARAAAKAKKAPRARRFGSPRTGSGSGAAGSLRGP